MNNKDKAVEKTELVINAIDYAYTHNLNISNKEDVKKILEVFVPERISEEEVKEFMDLLEHADAFMEVTASRKDKEKIELPN